MDLNNIPDGLTIKSAKAIIKALPPEAQRIFRASFNLAFEKNNNEQESIKTAWKSVLEEGYKIYNPSGNTPDSLSLNENPSKGGEMSPAGGGVGGGNHSEWDPVFKTGQHTDSEGNTKNWTLEELDTIVAKYNPVEHEPPVVIGHPEHNSPAWGWVEGLKREGELLYAKYKDLVPEFVDMVKRGFYKKKSISLYPDLTLRHIGFLGAMPPAVKGIPNTAFNADKKSINIEFGGIGTGNPKSEIQNMSSTQIGDPKSFLGREAKRMKLFDWMRKKAADEGVVIEDAPSFSEPGSGTARRAMTDIEMQELVDAEVAKVMSAKTAEFAETRQTLKAEGERLKAEAEKLEKAKAERQKDEIKSFCEGLCKEGKLTPATMKYGMGMDNFLEAISGIETQYDFCEPTEGKKLTPVEHMKGFLSRFKKQIEFGEFAHAGNDLPKGSDKREEAIRNYQEKNKKDGVEITYKEAVLAVSKEHPELFKQ